MQAITVLQVKPSERTGRDYKHRSRHETAPNPGLALDSQMLVFLSIWKDLLQQFLADVSEKDILESGFYGRGIMKHNNISVSADKQPLKLAPVKLDPF